MVTPLPQRRDLDRGEAGQQKQGNSPLAGDFMVALAIIQEAQGQHGFYTLMCQQADQMGQSRPESPGAFLSWLLSLAQQRIALADYETASTALHYAARLTSAGIHPARLTAPSQHIQPSCQEEGKVLSRREQEVLTLVGCGLKNSEIALQLGLAESTVHKHMQNIFEKLQARNRVEAISRAKLLEGPAVQSGHRHCPVCEVKEER
jgi:DNA-binding CsgD family transcriptional regulator